jgi:hypothetical protein
MSLSDKNKPIDFPLSFHSPACSPNRFLPPAHYFVILSVSEGSRSPPRQILRFTQDDTQVLYIQSNPLGLLNENVGAQFIAPAWGDQNKSVSSSKN